MNRREFIKAVSALAIVSILPLSVAGETLRRKTWYVAIDFGYKGRKKEEGYASGLKRIQEKIAAIKKAGGIITEDYTYDEDTDFNTMKLTGLFRINYLAPAV